MQYFPREVTIYLMVSKGRESSRNRVEGKLKSEQNTESSEEFTS